MINIYLLFRSGETKVFEASNVNLNESAFLNESAPVVFLLCYIFI